ncbi:peptidyl-tRNA hydrolase domain-containing protein [Phyllosticta citriasiana]|uniref:Peptidyl-tRNA hydrolase domain-containing protein n=1 Tax=Phyllosticta citriasiana TaxID=595635 RepID=A0ABR1L0D9_9PEZI
MRNNSWLKAPTRALSATAVLSGKPLPPRFQINEDDIEEKFLKGSGPGGQKINKTSSAVQLKHLPTGMVVKFQGTRSREQNRKTARKMLSERLEEMELGDQSRTAIKRANAAKKKASKSKKSRRKYRALDEAKKAAAAEDGEEDGDAEGGQGGVREEQDDAKEEGTGKS